MSSSSNNKKTQRIVWSSVAVIVSLVAGTAIYNTYFKTTAKTTSQSTNERQHFVLQAEQNQLSPIVQEKNLPLSSKQNAVYPVPRLESGETPSLNITENNTRTEKLPHDATTSEDDFSNDELSAEDLAQIEGSLTEDAKSAIQDLLDSTQQARNITEQFEYTVKKGDSFSKILDQSGLEDNVGHQLTSQFPSFHNDLRPGQEIYWTLNNDGKLMYLNWIVNKQEERIYTRTPDNTFTVKVIKQESEWQPQILQGKITHSLNKSFTDLGINSTVANQAKDALQWQTDMRALQPGDKFALDILREFVDGKPTSRAKLNAVLLQTKGTKIYAIKADNGNFYDAQGGSTGKGFNRYPLKFTPRVSSHFNLHRRHPITGRVRPHKGVDFAVPMNTPVYAPADGVVEHVRYQPSGAGRYVVIKHSAKYQTIYMHLHRSNVKVGQKVKRGQLIAFSGNSGRSTGPHLHYEFRINGQPWNPLSVKLPNVTYTMSAKEKKAFLEKAKKVQKELVIK